MCGIVGRVGPEDGVDELLSGLSNLEYRGYDSAGVATVEDGRPVVRKREGRLSDLTAAMNGDLSGVVGIGHTRWSTHGPPSDANAHPHTDCSGEVAVVHNGIVRNYESLREDLRARGHEFQSETDTEVIPHLVEEALADGLDPEAALRRAVDRLEGSYAVAVVVAGEDAVYGTRQGLPLVVGVGDDRYYLASDVPAFLEFTDRVIHLSDGEFVTIRPDGLRTADADGDPVVPAVETVEWSAEDVGKGGYDHYMRKEIDEQPGALRQAVRGRVLDDGSIRLDLPDETFTETRRVQFVGCGTSFHAAKYATELCLRRGIPATAFLASEYVASPPPVPEGTLVVGVTQSGETADTLSALRTVESARTLALTNHVNSTAARECDDVLPIHAGPEIGVAATKTFSSQVATVGLLLERLAEAHPDATPAGEPFRTALLSLPDAVERLLDRTDVDEVVRAQDGAAAYFFVGRGTGYAVALEGALKFKEITYEHAEGFAAGELKHGPLALVTDRTPVFGVLTGEGTNDERTRHNLEEARSRGAPIVAATTTPETVRGVADHVLALPETHPELAGVLANVQFQLLAYHAAAALDRAIDKPRNLAKSVTVE
jgi:glucosamine--fructose-6-phosphate aminotransferase (isomerizing)